MNHADGHHGCLVSSLDESRAGLDTRLNARNNHERDSGYGYAEYNFNKVLGLVADLGAYHIGNAGGVQLGSTTFQYLFGPRFNWRRSRFTPYVETLVGGSSTTQLQASAQNNFTAAIGGGIDINLTNRIAVKPVQVEYLATQFSTGATNLNFVQNNLRYSAGVVFRFGSK